MQCLLDAGDDKEKATNASATLLYIAALHGHQAVVQCLLDAGADKDKATNKGATPLHFAAQEAHQTMIQCLLHASVDKEKATNAGAAPLHLAAQEAHQAVVQCLLDAGAVKAKVSNKGFTIAFCSGPSGSYAWWMLVLLREGEQFDAWQGYAGPHFVVLTKRRQTKRAPQSCILLHRIAIRQLRCALLVDASRKQAIRGHRNRQREAC